MTYVLKKTGVLIVSLILISLLAFLAFQIIPGDPTTKILGTDYTPERAEALREQLGLNAPLPARYLSWLKGLVSGDPGISYSYFMPVKDVMQGKLQVTAALSLVSWVLVMLFSIPLGILLARFQGSRLERTGIVLNQVFMAVPPFFLGILFTYLFGLVLHWFMPGGYVPFSQSFWGAIGYLIFPSLAVAIPKAAKTAKLLRSSILNEMEWSTSIKDEVNAFRTITIQMHRRLGFSLTGIVPYIVMKRMQSRFKQEMQANEENL